MLKMGFHIVVLGLLNGCLGWAVLSLHDRSLTYEIWETDSVLEVMPQNEDKDLLVLGSSHGYVLSRFEAHHTILEEGLGKDVFNMALPSGGSVVPAELYLEYYFEQGNQQRKSVIL